MRSEGHRLRYTAKSAEQKEKKFICENLKRKKNSKRKIAQKSSNQSYHFTDERTEVQVGQMSGKSAEEPK